MLTDFTEAERIAGQELVNLSDGSGDVWMFTDIKQIDEAGWLFFYNTRAFAIDGNLSCALAGNIPMLVNHAGELSYLTVDEYEKLLGQTDQMETDHMKNQDSTSNHGK